MTEVAGPGQVAGGVAPGAPRSLPEPIASMVAGASWDHLAGGVSDAEVMALRWPDGATAVLKSADPVGPGAGADLLADERDRLEWLQGRVPVPEVQGWASDPSSGRAHLLLSTLPGVSAIDPRARGEVEALVRALAAGLRRFHELPRDECPFAAPVDARLAIAGARVRAGLVDEDDFELAYQRYPVERLYELLLEARRGVAEDDLVVVHGDFSLANVMVDQGEVVGFVDVGRCGLSDRYLDLAIAARSLAHHVSPEALGPFFVEYGIDYPDLGKIDFYVLLDEFF